MERHRPDVLESFQDLVRGGGVELLAETYYQPLAFLHSNKEFEHQVDMHLEKLEDLFHIRPRVFRNNKLIYNDAIAAKAETMGFDGVIAEGVEWNLGGESPNFLYCAPQTARIKTLPRNNRLSDDLGFRFSDPSCTDHPLTPVKFARWLAESPGDIVNLFLGYETIVEHPFGTIKDRHGYGGLLCRGLSLAGAEMGLSAWAYNFTRVINLVGAGGHQFRSRTAMAARSRADRSFGVDPRKIIQKSPSNRIMENS